MKHVCNNKKSKALFQMIILLHQGRVIVRALHLPILYNKVKILALLPQEKIWFTDLI